MLLLVGDGILATIFVCLATVSSFGGGSLPAVKCGIQFVVE
jgi:hypothetical protein